MAKAKRNTKDNNNGSNAAEQGSSRAKQETVTIPFLAAPDPIGPVDKKISAFTSPATPNSTLAKMFAPIYGGIAGASALPLVLGKGEPSSLDSTGAKRPGTIELGDGRRVGLSDLPGRSDLTVSSPVRSGVSGPGSIRLQDGSTVRLSSPSAVAPVEAPTSPVAPSAPSSPAVPEFNWNSSEVQGFYDRPISGMPKNSTGNTIPASDSPAPAPPVPQYGGLDVPDDIGSRFDSKGRTGALLNYNGTQVPLNADNPTLAAMRNRMDGLSSNSEEAQALRSILSGGSAVSPPAGSRVATLASSPSQNWRMARMADGSSMRNAPNTVTPGQGGVSPPASPGSGSLVSGGGNPLNKALDDAIAKIRSTPSVDYLPNRTMTNKGYREVTNHHWNGRKSTQILPDYVYTEGPSIPAPNARFQSAVSELDALVKAGELQDQQQRTAGLSDVQRAQADELRMRLSSPAYGLRDVDPRTLEIMMATNPNAAKNLLSSLTGVEGNAPDDLTAFLPKTETGEASYRDMLDVFFRANNRLPDGLEELQQQYPGVIMSEADILGEIIDTGVPWLYDNPESKAKRQAMMRLGGIGNASDPVSAARLRRQQLMQGRAQ